MIAQARKFQPATVADRRRAGGLGSVRARSSTSPPSSCRGRRTCSWRFIAAPSARCISSHLQVTLTETLIGFAVGMLARASCSAPWSRFRRRTEYFLYPFIVMFQAMPKVALAPIIIVWFGLGLTSKVVTAALVAFFPLLVNTIVGPALGRRGPRQPDALARRLALADLLDAATAERHALHLRRAGDRDDLRAARRHRRRAGRRANPASAC